MIEMTIPVSPEMEDIIFDHVFYNKELFVYADEKAWVLHHMKKKNTYVTLRETHLDITTCSWKLKVIEYEKEDKATKTSS